MANKRLAVIIGVLSAAQLNGAGPEPFLYYRFDSHHLFLWKSAGARADAAILKDGTWQLSTSGSERMEWTARFRSADLGRPGDDVNRVLTRLAQGDVPSGSATERPLDVQVSL